MIPCSQHHLHCPIDCSGRNSALHICMCVRLELSSGAECDPARAHSLCMLGREWMGDGTSGLRVRTKNDVRTPVFRTDGQITCTGVWAGTDKKHLVGALVPQVMGNDSGASRRTASVSSVARTRWQLRRARRGQTRSGRVKLTTGTQPTRL